MFHALRIFDTRRESYEYHIESDLIVSMKVNNFFDEHCGDRQLL